MEQAQRAIEQFLHRDGHADTTVHEIIAPAVINEHIMPTRHEEVFTAVDREVHQAHYHTTIQPIQDREVLPVEHIHNEKEVVSKEIRHGDEVALRERLEAERAKFISTKEVAETIHTTSEVKTIIGEHVHHHIHETIQPLIQKEVIQHSVVHTIIPIHEVHHHEAIIKTTTALPAISMEAFLAKGGSLSGLSKTTEQHDAFAGAPRPNSANIGGPGAAGTTTLTSPSSRSAHHIRKSSLAARNMSIASADKELDWADRVSNRRASIDTPHSNRRPSHPASPSLLAVAPLKINRTSMDSDTCHTSSTPHTPTNNRHTRNPSQPFSQPLSSSSAQNHKRSLTRSEGRQSLDAVLVSSHLSPSHSTTPPTTPGSTMAPSPTPQRKPEHGPNSDAVKGVWARNRVPLGERDANDRFDTSELAQALSNESRGAEKDAKAVRKVSLIGKLRHALHADK